MSDEFQAVKDIATHPATGTGVAGVLSFLIHKVWRGHRHEINGMKSATSIQGVALEKVNQKLEEHALLDQELFRDIQRQMSENHKEILEHLINLKGE